MYITKQQAPRVNSTIKDEARFKEVFKESGIKQ